MNDERATVSEDKLRDVLDEPGPSACKRRRDFRDGVYWVRLRTGAPWRIARVEWRPQVERFGSTTPRGWVANLPCRGKAQPFSRTVRLGELAEVHGPVQEPS